MEDAFRPEYDPALELATYPAKNPHRVELEQQEEIDPELKIQDPGPWTQHLRRKEQSVIDMIVHGVEMGHYYVLLGAKVMSCPSRRCGWNFSTFTSGYGENCNDSGCYGIHSSRWSLHV